MSTADLNIGSIRYVFSTKWANSGAEAVLGDQFPSLASWHEAQPEHVMVSAIAMSFEQLLTIKCGNLKI